MLAKGSASRFPHHLFPSVFNITMTATLSPDGKRVHVADIGNHRVRMIDLETNLITTVAGNGHRGLPEDGANALETALGAPGPSPRPPTARSMFSSEEGTPSWR